MGDNLNSNESNFHDVNNQDVNLFESSNVSDNGKILKKSNSFSSDVSEKSSKSEKNKDKSKKKHKVKKMLKKLEKRIIHGGKKDKGREINYNMNLEDVQEEQKEINRFVQDENITETNQFIDEIMETQYHEQEKENSTEELMKNTELGEIEMKPNEIVKDKLENENEEKIVETGKLENVSEEKNRRNR